VLTSYTMTPEQECYLRCDKLIIAALPAFLPTRKAKSTAENLALLELTGQAS
jgi:hypothetical protein